MRCSDADWDRVLAVNLSGPFYLARRCVPGMAERRWGRVINVSSISSRVGTPGMTAYCASKWGLNGFTQALAAEVKERNVLVAAVLPGSVDTDMLKGSGWEPEMNPTEVARVVTFLCARLRWRCPGAWWRCSDEPSWQGAAGSVP